jgi:hypothetical protein
LAASQPYLGLWAWTRVQTEPTSERAMTIVMQSTTRCKRCRLAMHCCSRKRE